MMNIMGGAELLQKKFSLLTIRTFLRDSILKYLEPMALNQALNRIPLKAIDYQYSIDALRAKLVQIIT